LQAFKFEGMPNGEQLRNLRQFAGSCRFVYNKALALNRERYEKKEQRLGYAKLCALLPTWKLEHPFLSEVPAQALQQALKNLDRAYANYFQKRADFPKFKKKGQPQSFRIPQGFEVDNQNGRIKLRNWDGCATANHETSWVNLATSPSASLAASGMPQSKPNEKSKRRSIRPCQSSGWIGASSTWPPCPTEKL
jgi:transposase